MSWFYGLKIRYKFFIPISIISLLLVILGGVSISRFQVVDQKVVELRDINLLALSYLMSADTEMHKAVIEERSMIFLDVSSPNFSKSLDNHNKSILLAHENIELFSHLINADSIAGLFDDYVAARDNWERLTRQVAEERKANTRIGRSTAIELSFKDADVAFNLVRKTISALIDRVNTKANESVTASRKTVNTSRNIIMLLVLFGLAVGVLMILITPVLVVDPINKIIRFMNDLANGEGDLTQKVRVDHNDELGEMSGSINDFIESLRLLLVRVVSVGQRFDGQSKTLHNLANSNHELAKNQSNEVALATDALYELSRTVEEVSYLSGSASEKAQIAREHSDEGKSIVAGAIAAIDKLAKDVQSSTNVVLKLNEDSGNIASVVNVIKGIAEQINLLALNAAIEAARAGEQGRGFAVVADSVRELAFKTAESTHEIQAMISVLKESAVRAADAMHNNKNTAENSVHQANLAGAALSRIDIAVIEMSQLNAEIANASVEQLRASNQIKSSTSNISGFSKKSAALTNEVEDSTQQLAKLAGELDKELRKFKL